MAMGRLLRLRKRENKGMEKVKISDLTNPDRYYYEWQLTKDEKNEIRSILKDKSPQKIIDSFIHYLQGLCMLKKTMLLEQPSRSKVRLARERILTDCKAALGHLKQCEKGECITWYNETIDPFWSHLPEQKKICPECNHPFSSLGGLREKCVQCDPTPLKIPHKNEDHFLVQFLDSSWAAVGPLEKFIKVLEKYHKSENKKNGRKKADSDHFIEKIRDIYIEHIGTPTTYEGGHFFEVVRVVLNLLGLPKEDPSRGIREALKK
jgi:hypothetical protein